MGESLTFPSPSVHIKDMWLMCVSICLSLSFGVFFFFFFFTLTLTLLFLHPSLLRQTKIKTFLFPSSLFPVWSAGQWVSEWRSVIQLTNKVAQRGKSKKSQKERMFRSFLASLSTGLDYGQLTSFHASKEGGRMQEGYNGWRKWVAIASREVCVCASHFDQSEWRDHQ